MPDLVRCANCLAPLRLDVGPVVACAYCGAHTRLDAPATVSSPPISTGVRLAETIAFVVKPTLKIPFLKAGSAVPLFHTETLSTSRDDQDSLQVNLVEGESPIGSFAFPLEQRKPRGTVMVALTVRVSTTGAMSLTLTERATKNALDRDGFTVRVLPSA